MEAAAEGSRSADAARDLLTTKRGGLIHKAGQTKADQPTRSIGVGECFIRVTLVVHVTIRGGCWWCCLQCQYTAGEQFGIVGAEARRKKPFRSMPERLT